MDTNRLQKQTLQYKPKGRRNIGRPRKRWRDQLHLEDQGKGNTPNPSGTWYICDITLFSFFKVYEINLHVFLTAEWLNAHTVHYRSVTRRQRTNHCPHHSQYNCVPKCSRHFSWTAWPLNRGPISYPETSVTNYQSAPHKIAADRRSDLLKANCCVLRIFVTIVSYLLLTEMGAIRVNWLLISKT